MGPKYKKDDSVYCTHYPDVPVTVNREPAFWPYVAFNRPHVLDTYRYRLMLPNNRKIWLYESELFDSPITKEMARARGVLIPNNPKRGKKPHGGERPFFRSHFIGPLNLELAKRFEEGGAQEFFAQFICTAQTEKMFGIYLRAGNLAGFLKHYARDYFDQLYNQYVKTKTIDIEL